MLMKKYPRIKEYQMMFKCKSCKSYFIFDEDSYFEKRYVNVYDAFWFDKIYTKDNKRWFFGLFREWKSGILYKIKIELWKCISCPACGNIHKIKCVKTYKDFNGWKDTDFIDNLRKRIGE